MTTRFPKITEKQFMAQIVQLARLCGWLVYHTHDSRRSEPGFPDLLMLKDGRIVVFECKVGKNKLTADQERWMLAFREVENCTMFVVYPDSWPLIKTLLMV